MSTCILYSATNTVNGNQYIGISTFDLATRAKRHIRTAKSGRGSVIGAAIRKYGSDRLLFKTMAVCPSWEYAKALEVAAIAAFMPEYNATKGGDGALGYRHTDEHKHYVSKVHRGSKHWLGKKHSPETRAKMRAARAAYWDKIDPSLRASHRRRPVVEAVSGQSFCSATEAAKHFGHSQGAVSANCRKSRPMRDGLNFKYINSIWAGAQNNSSGQT